MRLSIAWRGAALLSCGFAAFGSAVALSQAQMGAPAGATSAASKAGGGNDPGSRAEQIYKNTCAGCHGVDLSGGRGPSLFNTKLLASLNDKGIHETVENGIPGTEMPPFKGVLSDDEIRQVIAYLRDRSAALTGRGAFVPNPENRIVRSERQTFRIELVAKDLVVPWGLVALPDGRLLVTERPGRLRIVDRQGRLLSDPVSGTPKVWSRQDGGMLDVAIDPDYRRNKWIYLSFSEVQPGHVVTPAELNPPAGSRGVAPPTMTVLVRGRIDAQNRWVDQQVIFRAPASLYTANGAHYGSRFLFDSMGHLFFSLGERGDMRNAQDLGSPLGKIHRINRDGSVPQDNPFVRTPGVVPSIWTYGHRNPEGLAFDPATGLLWESEHGPSGGDEINLIERGKNYGWGVISMGVQPGITLRSAPGMEQPVAYYTPTIAPSGISFYTASRYPAWKGDMFVAALAGQQLRRITVRGRTITHQEVLFEQFGRVRAVATGTDGLLYVLIQNPTGAGTGVPLSGDTPGMVVRLVPTK